MKSGVCPKCGAKDIRLDESSLSDRNSLTLGFTAWSHGPPLRIQNYICAACGYLENYVCTEDLDRLASARPRINAFASKVPEFE
jgi:hypothetical protein